MGKGARISQLVSPELKECRNLSCKNMFWGNKAQKYCSAECRDITTKKIRKECSKKWHENNKEKMREYERKRQKKKKELKEQNNNILKMKLLIHEEEKNYFDRFYIIVSKILESNSLKNKDIKKFKIHFKNAIDKTIEFYTQKEYEKAREIMGSFILELQMCRMKDQLGFHFKLSEEEIDRIKKHLDNIKTK